MDIFNKKTTIESDEYKKLSIRCLEVEQEIEKIKQKFSSLELENADLRNKVLRKIQYRQEVEEPKQKPKLKAGERYNLKR